MRRQFLSKQFLVGVVGYLYQEVGCDSQSGDHVGCVTRRRPWPAGRLPLSHRGSARISKLEGLRGVRRLGSARRLEHLAHVCHLACHTDAAGKAACVQMIRARKAIGRSNKAREALPPVNHVAAEVFCPNLAHAEGTHPISVNAGWEGQRRARRRHSRT